MVQIIYPSIWSIYYLFIIIHAHYLLMLNSAPDLQGSVTEFLNNS